MKKATLKKSILSSLLLILFLGYLGSITLFTHSHYINGELVTHSHPYTGTTDNPGHGHSVNQILTIAQLSLLLMLGLVFTYLFSSL